MIIISRAEWGARAPAGFAAAALPARELYLHHSVTIAPDLLPPFDDDDAAVRTLERIGQERFGGGISYTFAITPVGRVYEGHGIARQGAHTGGRNTIARAICLVGNYDTATPPAPMVQAAAELVAHGHRAGWWPATLTGGHRDAPGASTACPGRHAHALIPEINRLATASTPAPAPAAPAQARPQLTYGMRAHPVVRRVQAFMADRFPLYAKHLPATGNYLDLTVGVVAEFQRRTGVTGPDANGRTIGPRTWAQLVAHGYR